MRHGPTKSEEDKRISELKTGCLLLGEEVKVSIYEHDLEEVYHKLFRLIVKVV